MRSRSALAALVLVLLAIACYWPALSGGFIWDDDALTANPHMGSWRGLFAIWSGTEGIPHEQHWWPVTYTSFWIEHALWGFDPRGYHATNVLLHALNAVLLWRILVRLSVPGALFGAALFAAHPVHVESVAWVIERKDVLSAALALASTLSLLRYRGDGVGARLFLALALFALACLAKSMVVALPLSLAFGLWWKDGKLEASLLPLCAIALALALVDVSVSGGADPLTDVDLSALERLGAAGGALGYYARTLLFPRGLSPVPPFAAVGPVDLALAAGWLLLFAVLFSCRRRIGRAPVAVLCAWVVALAPVLGLVEFSWQRHALVADRFQYFASAIALPALAALGVRALERARVVRAVGRGAALLVLALLSVATLRYTRVFASEASHARRILAVNPKAWAGHFNLGRVLTDEGLLEPALGSYDRSIELRADYGAAHGNRGLVLWRLGRLEEAERAFQRALELDPGLASAHNNLGVLLTGRKAFAEAERHLARALELAPRDPATIANLGLLFAKSGRLERAVAEFRRALALDPNEPVAKPSLVTALELRPDLR